jgi:hypothetical protein
LIANQGQLRVVIVLDGDVPRLSSDQREIRCWPTTIPLLVLDLMATTSGIYEIQALLPQHKAGGRFVTIEEAQITQARLALSPED